MFSKHVDTKDTCRWRGTDRHAHVASDGCFLSLILVIVATTLNVKFCFIFPLTIVASAFFYVDTHL